MWYENGETKTIQENKPIFAENCVGAYILLPQIDKDYESKGFNWFNIKTGLYDSSKFYQSVDEAVNSRKANYNICNGELELVE